MAVVQVLSVGRRKGLSYHIYSSWGSRRYLWGWGSWINHHSSYNTSLSIRACYMAIWFHFRVVNRLRRLIKSGANFIAKRVKRLAVYSRGTIWISIDLLIFVVLLWWDLRVWVWVYVYRAKTCNYCRRLILFKIIFFWEILCCSISYILVVFFPCDIRLKAHPQMSWRFLVLSFFVPLKEVGLGTPKIWIWKCCFSWRGNFRKWDSSICSISIIFC